MKNRSIMIVHAILVIPTALLTGCQTTQTARQSQRAPIEPIPHVVTSDIQNGIEHYIEEQTRLGSGTFTVPFKDELLSLKLVRVHIEYLANLGPRRHFACVDLASTDGNVYDVDFFLAGDPGDMTVTETTVHKINGRPLYVWKQDPDRTWGRADIEDATPVLLGVIEDRDQFEFIYQFTLPQMSDDARLWLPLPESNRFQSIETIAINTPGTQDVLTDVKHGNKILFVELSPEDSGESIELRFAVERIEKSVYVDDDTSPNAYLGPDKNVPINDEIRTIAAEALVGKQQNDLTRARALYDHTIDRMSYIKVGSDYGKGDAMYACDSGTGNCTDYHSYFIALARASGIPARFAIGASIPSTRNNGGMSGYHCWAEFYAEGKWWPIDISEADKYTALATYYFGRHPANRLELSRGRDLIVEPGPVSGPINFLAYPVLEVAGQPVPIKPQFGFRRPVN